MPKTILMIILVIAALAVLIPLGVIVFYMTLNRTNGTIQSSGIARKYLLYVPKSYDKTKPTPLVISIHGFIEWPAHQMQISHWNKLADEHGFIVVYPSGTGIPLRWDAFPRAGGGNDGLRDVRFIADLIDKLEREYNIDPTRIYANGLSNGGGMSFLLACKLADRIAAIGGVAGAYSTPWSECSPSRPVPVIVFHGDADPIVPYAGGTVSRAGFTFPAIPDWVAGWAQHNGCTSPPLDLPASGAVSGIHYPGCTQNADVTFYTIHGGGHSWPGGKGLPKFIVGNTTQDIDATQVMWDFFREHPLVATGD